MNLKKQIYWCAGVTVAGLYFSATTLAETDEKKSKIDEIVVVGTHIKGAAIDGALPVTVMTRDDITAMAVGTGDELLRAIPQVGEVAFNNERDIGGINDARGDVASINLRGLGTGNTLTLLNGRRLVLHPATQSENFVPVVTSNSNTLPVKALDRVEVLLDGASAIYGTDAVAGVINYVLRDDYEGAELSARYSSSESSALNEMTLNGAGGFFFNDGESHLTLTGSYYHRDPMYASDRDYSKSEDLRNYPGLPEEFIGDSQLLNTSSSAPWGIFDSASGRFRILPDTVSSCDVALADGVCRDNGSATSLPNELRFDAAPHRTMSSEVDRFNFSSQLNHQLSESLELFGEFLYYQAESSRQREQNAILTAQRFTISDSAALNPFGEEITVRSYRPLDAGGGRDIEVKDTSVRLLGGLRGEFANTWDWESALLYSKAESSDVAHNRIRADYFQQAVNSTNLTTAYNIFNGGDLNNPTTLDSTPNSAAVVAPFLVSVSRDSESILSLADFKISTAELFSLPGGDAGLAAGIEFRKEEFADDRDSLLDGSLPFIDMNTSELLSDSNVLGSSPTPDTSGDRSVFSLYGELALPVLESVDVQLALRYEDFSDVGSVLKPKVAVLWSPLDWMQVRGSYSEGFRAPNIAQVSDPGTARVNTRQDPVQGGSQSVENIRSGSENLEPEEDTSYSFGFVFKPQEDVTITMDWWRIEQEGVIGILGDQNHILYDSLLRSDFGTTNPNVIRDPSGDILQVVDEYLNLLPRTIEGIDVALHYSFGSEEAGDFKLSFNGAYLSKFDQEPDAITAQLLAAQNAGNPAVPVSISIDNAGSLIQIEGRPRWRHSASLIWNKNEYSAGISGSYIGHFYDTSVTTSEGDPLPVDSYKEINVYAGYEFSANNFLQNTSIRIGIRNVQDNDPPLADETFGYASDVHTNRGRQYYFDLTQRF